MSAWYGILAAMLNTIAGVIVGVLLSVATAGAQTKPIGLFDPGSNPPDWASFGTIGDTVSDERFVEARQMSESQGFVWVLALAYYEDPRTPITAHAQRVLDRLRDTGLLPYVVAFSLGEEWYERWQGGAFAAYGLTADNPAGTSIIRDWLGRQHLAAKTVLGRPVIWITNVGGHTDGTFRPIPPHTDYVALDPYMPTGGSFDVYVAPLLAFTEQSTTLPLILIPQYFAQDGYEPVNEVMVARYASILARPQYAAMMAFTWRDRLWMGMTGLENLPIRAAVERSLGVK